MRYFLSCRFKCCFSSSPAVAYFHSSSGVSARSTGREVELFLLSNVWWIEIRIRDNDQNRSKMLAFQSTLRDERRKGMSESGAFYVKVYVWSVNGQSIADMVEVR